MSQQKEKNNFHVYKDFKFYYKQNDLWNTERQQNEVQFQRDVPGKIGIKRFAYGNPKIYEAIKRHYDNEIHFHSMNFVIQINHVIFILISTTHAIQKKILTKEST